MPFARISLARGKSREYLRALSDELHAALVESFEVPADDKFQVIHQHDPEDMIFDPHYMGVDRSPDLVYITLTTGKPRSTETKKRFYQTLVRRLAARPGIRSDDVMVVISTSQRDEWSFGGGLAQMVEDAS
ncbi:MAG TPA: tautomerase family protein [Burkholderiaceae bacterium]|nr:tautomerase family protein [Burkholderiaceae bacterium]